MIPYRSKVFIGINVREIRDCQNRERFKLAKNIFPQTLDAWNPCWCALTWFHMSAHTGIWTQDLLIKALAHYKDLALYQLRYTSIPTLPKSLRLVANHWAREYREKTTTSQIFMPCNLSSCRVYEINRFSDTFILYLSAVAPLVK